MPSGPEDDGLVAPKAEFRLVLAPSAAVPHGCDPSRGDDRDTPRSALKSGLTTASVPSSVAGRDPAATPGGGKAVLGAPEVSVGTGGSAPSSGCSSPMGLSHEAGCREPSATSTAPVGRGTPVSGAGTSASLCTSVAGRRVAVSPLTPGAVGASLCARAEPGLDGNTAGSPCLSPSPGPSKLAGLSPAWLVRREFCPGFSAAPNAVTFSGGSWGKSAVLKTPCAASPTSPDFKAAHPGVSPTVPLTTSPDGVGRSPLAPGLGIAEGALPSPWPSPGRVTSSTSAPASGGRAVRPGRRGVVVIACVPAAVVMVALRRNVASAVDSKPAPALVVDAGTSAKAGVLPRGAAAAVPVTLCLVLGVKLGCGVTAMAAALAAAEPLWYFCVSSRDVATSVPAWGSPVGACVTSPALSSASLSAPRGELYPVVSVTESGSAQEGEDGLMVGLTRMLSAITVSLTVLVPTVPSSRAVGASPCDGVAANGPSVVTGTAAAVPSPAWEHRAEHYSEDRTSGPLAWGQ